MLKLNKLFYQSNSLPESFNQKLKPTSQQEQYLRSCIKKIRGYLKPKIKEATVDILGMDKPVEPKFRTQGSWSYKTCVIPAYQSQEMDWDYGMYLPVEVMEDNGSPKVMAQVYFNLVESLLNDLCESEGWQLETQHNKNTCVRIKVSNWAHLDIPLYAAPASDFNRIVESRMTKAMNRQYSHESAGDDITFAESQSWEDLDSVFMATREGEWIDSDPKVVSDWFEDRCNEFSEQLRRVCCYFKAWRDFHWVEKGPSSVSLMIAITQGFKIRKGRDDLAIEEAAKRLSESFKSDIREVGIDNEKEDFNRLSEGERYETARKFLGLYNSINNARSQSIYRKEISIQEVINQFGRRIPNEVNYIEEDNDASNIRKTPAEKVAPPVVPSTKAG